MVIHGDECLRNYGKIHHAINGKIHEIVTLFDSKLLVYQRVIMVNSGCECGFHSGL